MNQEKFLTSLLGETPKQRFTTTIAAGETLGALGAMAIHAAQLNGPAVIVDLVVAVAPVAWSPDGRRALKESVQYIIPTVRAEINLLRPKIHPPGRGR